jgi:hypothetical protein
MREEPSLKHESGERCDGTNINILLKVRIGSGLRRIARPHLSVAASDVQRKNSYFDDRSRFKIRLRVEAEIFLLTIALIATVRMHSTRLSHSINELSLVTLFVGAGG